MNSRLWHDPGKSTLPEVSSEGSGPLNTRVLIVGEQDVVRPGLRTAFGATEGIEVAGETGDLRGARSHTERLAPDVVVVALTSSSENGLAVVRDLSSARERSVRVLVPAASDDKALLFGCLRAGARDYILTGSGADVITDAVRSLAEGRTVLDPAVIGTLVGEFVRYGVVPRAGAGGSGTGWDEGFTARERDVVEHVTTGAGNAEIAGTLGLSETTAKSHVFSVLTELHLRNRIRTGGPGLPERSRASPFPGRGAGADILS
ncbi:LuxR C-terminal-related transcriptional regulator [Nocardiopsis alba]|uniref:response regulator transcription factor n=1 Tax=Nocardiopsis alba TaxID=53437 RepID=UPI0033C560C0